MRELRTFGGLSIQDDGASLTGAAIRRKTLALLALLAAADNHGTSRDKLIACLWPEGDTERGRNLLKQACFGLRRDLHEPELFLGTTELRLNPAAILSDVHAFQEAVGRGDLAGAVGLYRGPFLDGFYLNGAPEFERWVETERARIARVVCEALESLATRAAAHGDHRAAEKWWRRLTQIDPLSSRAALGLMRALVAAGEPAAAIRHAQAHEAYVEQELGSRPDAAIPALVKQLCEDAEHGSSALDAASAPRRRQSTTDFLLAALPAALRRELHRATTLSTAAAGLAIVLVIGAVGYGVSGRRPGARGPEPVSVAGRKMLVVLPFENRGAPGDQYFADGLSEAIASRLGSIRSVGIIAWQSASQYKGTTKSPQEIGGELGVQYILAGSVRWERAPGAPSRVRVTPTLTRVSDGAQLWADQYDTVLAGVFAVQANLATRVAGALDISLIDAERHLLESRPTQNLAAYDAYLRGRELADREFNVANVRVATRMFEQAVALDTSFALAYAWLSVNHVWLYANYVDRSPEQLRQAKTALDRALHLDPTLPESHAALGFYYFNVLWDYDRALEEFTLARRSRPNDQYFAAVIGDVYEQQGHWNQALAYGQEAVLLDPRNILLALVIGDRYTALRRFDAASYYYDRAYALAPQSVEARVGRALVHLNLTGDLVGAQSLLPDVAENIVPTGLKPQITSLCDIVTLLSAAQQARLLRLSPAALEGDTAALALAKGIVYRSRGTPTLARASFDSARVALQDWLRRDPSDRVRHAMLGLAFAGLGRSQEAVHEGEQATEFLPVSKDAMEGAVAPANLARIYVLLDEPEKAISQLEIVLSRPGPLSPAWLRADPFWNPLRASPRFQRVVAANN